MKRFITTFDNQGLKYMQGRPAQIRPIMTLVSVIGQPIIILSVASTITVLAWSQNQSRIAIAALLTIVAFCLNSILKYFLHRTRPDTLYVTQKQFKSFSFPSGHAFGGVVVFGLLAYLSWLYLPISIGYLVAYSLGLLIVLIGLSRVYLGAHYATDVLGGWLLGVLALYLIITNVNP